MHPTAPRPLLRSILSLVGLAGALGAQATSGTALGPSAERPFAQPPRGAFLECVRLVRTFQGEAAGDQFGWVSAPIPDLDGDGVDEVAITAPFHDANGNASGRVTVVSPRTGHELFHADGNGGGWQLGISVRDAGDVNGDGVCDVIAGAPFPSSRGRIQVWSGKPSDHGALLLAQRQGSVGGTFGASVTGLGDVDGDGFGDVAGAAPLDDTAGANAGRVWVLSGADGGETVLWTIDGDAAGDQLGTALARLRDVTGDGRDELIVGARNAGPGQRGQAYVYDVAAQTRLYTLDADASAVDFGLFFVADAGDVNANGFADVYVSDFSDAALGPGTGRAYVFEGQDGARLWALGGAQAGEGFGIGRGMGDANGDGHADLLLCGWTDGAGASGAGKAVVVSGSDLSVLQEVTSTFPGEGLGFDAHGIGDVDGDGELDLFLTAAVNAAGGALSGRCYVVAGGAPVAARGGASPGTGGLVPTLACSGCPRLGTSVVIELGDALGGASGVLVLGDEEIALGVLGATLVPAPVVLEPFALDGPAGQAGAGSASFVLPLGMDPAALGSALVLQAAVFDPAASGGLAFSGALRLERTQP